LSLVTSQALLTATGTISYRSECF